MKAANLLTELKRRGIEVSLQGDDIAYRAPKGTMTSELLARFKSQKPAIVDELKAQRAEQNSGLGQLIQTLENDVDAGKPQCHPYAKYVEPLKSRLLERVGLDISFRRGEGCYLFDDDGNRYLDCIAQYGGLPFGYNPPEIWQAIDRVRGDCLPNVATQSLLNSAGTLAERLLDLLPASFQHVIFTNSGAEATEVAIKLCRSAKNRPGIISTRRGFHGLTTGALSTTGSESFQNGFFVRCEDFAHVDFGNSEDLRNVLTNAPNHFSAFIVEPIQGEAGILLPPEGYLKRVREICNEFDVLLVLDEVQTGLGRTGSMFAFEREAIEPDVVTLAKALGGGLVPCGAVACNSNAYSTRFGIRHSSTFAGNTMASECALAAIEWLTRGQSALIDSVKSTGRYLLKTLKAIQEDSKGLVNDVRGIGLMIAVEFDFKKLNSHTGLIPILVEQRFLLHLMISYLLHHHQIRVAPTFMGRDVIRIEPPLTFTTENCDQLVNAIEDVVNLVNGGNTTALISSMIDATATERQELAVKGYPAKIKTKQPADKSPAIADGEFGFLVHLSDVHDLVRFDPSLSILSESQLHKLKHELTRSSEPTLVGSTPFYSASGRTVVGHFVLVPHTPSELIEMDRDWAIDQIRLAALVAAEKNVRLIGLGGFTSILTYGGLALADQNIPPLTSGNAFTAAASMIAIEAACETKGIKIEHSTVAVVGAAGQIGRAIAKLFFRMGSRLLLVGRDGNDPRTQSSLIEVKQTLTGQTHQANVRTATDISEIVEADIVVAVSSAVEPFIKSDHIKKNAIVCDSSRPANVSDSTIASRPDATWIEGGLVQIPGCDQLDVFAGPNPKSAYACVAESALWALEPELGLPSAKKILDEHQIKSLRDASIRNGFKVII